MVIWLLFLFHAKAQRRKALLSSINGLREIFSKRKIFQNTFLNTF